MKRTITYLMTVYGLVLSPSGWSEEAKYDWTGAYVGASIGVAWTGSHLSANSNNFSSGATSYSENIDATDADPGAQLGYLYQFDEHWVGGIEGDFTYPASNSSKIHGADDCGCYDKFTVRNNVQGSLRLRGGYAFDNIFPYITTGVSFGSLGLYYNNELNNAYSTSTTQTGWVLGGGVEYGVMENMSVRAEYLYTDYGSALNMNLPVIGSAYDAAGSAHADMSVNVLRAAFNYRF
jgi:opacity protein-like surface antigen